MAVAHVPPPVAGAHITSGMTMTFDGELSYWAYATPETRSRKKDTYSHFFNMFSSFKVFVIIKLANGLVKLSTSFVSPK